MDKLTQLTEIQCFYEFSVLVTVFSLFFLSFQLRCRALGGYLAEITDAETNTFLKNHLKVQWYDGKKMKHKV